MTSNDDYVIEVLEDLGLVTHGQVAEARQAVTGEKTPVDVLVDTKVLAKRDVLMALAGQFGMEMIDLGGVDVSANVLSTVSPEVARRYRIVPLYENDGVLTVAISDPLDVDTLDSLRYVLRRDVEGVVALPEQVEETIRRYYTEPESSEDTVMGSDDDAIGLAGTSTQGVMDQGAATEADTPIIKLVSLIIVQAYRNRATDIHLEPLEKRFRVRYRIDGVLHEVESPPKRLQPAIISRVKIMAQMKMSEKRVPQDGRIQIKVLGKELDLRVSTVPSSHGESIVMRILDKENLAMGLSKLGFFADDQQKFERMIALADGILLVTGPTGSGKTTTLYACLNYLNRSDRKIITVEEPVEYQLSGINQVQMRADIGLTFAVALRSILRQAPNIIMIGEIRDFETADIAVHSSLTGHLVFSTLHTNDAPSAITRLVDIGVKPFLVASSLKGIMAQRLIRRICDNCKEQTQAVPAQLHLLGPAGEQLKDVPVYKGRGCNECAMTGYKGRMGIFEIFEITDEVREMIFEKVSAAGLRVRAREMGMRTLREDGIRKIVSGITTVEEVLRVTMGDVA
ncbi:MAG: type II/IV secretion system protein [Kiritimatiellae bacterium]|nr:type II/IV secretion system protein [Kiritimatiellia bacterium]